MTHPFISAILSSACPVIMEVKRHDGHGCDLLGDRSVGELVADYERAGAPCISVVTGRWFGGSQAMLGQARAATDRPLLQKDFFTSPRQVQRAADAGVDAVLLTAALLASPCLHDLVECTLGAGLVPFVEVDSAAQIDGLRHAGSCVIAVNNKDIRHRERDPGDLDRSTSLLPVVRATGTPCPVSASGIDSPASAAALVRQGFAGVLVGRAVLKTGSVSDWVEGYACAATGRPASPDDTAGQPSRVGPAEPLSLPA